MQVKLTPRLNKITQLVSEGSIVADIGTDHGYIPTYLIANNICSRVIASDVNEKPLKSAINNIKSYGFENQIETRLGNGLEVLKPHEVDTVIIAGMGGLLISELLNNSKEIIDTVDFFILQPMQAQEELRRYLVENKFTIVEDVLVKEDHRIYEIIKAKKGNQLVDDELKYEIGFHIEKNQLNLAEEFLEGKLKALREIILQVEAQKSAAAIEKFNYCVDKIYKIEEVQKWLKKLS
ncbi:tRNA (adenine(22)-N(1))-methyltransferase [Alkaliphilus peptidifermentans]|uniref:tRNA (Adenine22-N1)-methyltransferase n=1 Tax=Alkaliphilus peptidifermentans DSM 18978 TaxID=1120976 RepID=A0A1G5BNV0_9FIRM|nr:class I SAM-dependent methyltransferase [Alkaliphilus peptidifermentans]SCX91766.1 tRNA (adenine22-N1)-methyltransferase [Alkaliphilus peptidifermentans DSM 18978]